MSKLLLGADPEFFLKDKKTGMNVSAHGLVPGTKDKPYKLDHGAVQLDGTAVEFNIDPASDGKEFARNIKAVLDQLRHMIPEDYAFNFSPHVFYEKEYFDKEIPESSKELGCNPDFNAWKFGAVNPVPDFNQPMRTGSGHLHIGFTEGANVSSPDHIYDCTLLVRQLDSVFSYLEQFWDCDTERRKLYGNFGAFRPKSYGVEYRVLSNKWLHYPDLWPYLYDVVSFVYEQSMKGVMFGRPDLIASYCERSGHDKDGKTKLAGKALGAKRSYLIDDCARNYVRMNRSILEKISKATIYG